MLDVVTDAVSRLNRQRWWASVHEALDQMTEEDIAGSQSEVEGLDRTTVDGLGGT